MTTGRPAAVVFDVDGTLYVQKPMQLRMAAALLMDGPRRGRFVSPDLRILRAYRKEREKMRGWRSTNGELLADAELKVAATKSGAPIERVAAVVEDWIHRRPLAVLGRVARRGLRAGLERLREHGMKIGVFSDHKIGGKLDAMGVGDLVDAAVSALDPEVNVFKPDPRGFLRTCELLGVEPSTVLYVGDRYDVDIIGARAAGMDAVLIGKREAPDDVRRVRSVGELVVSLTSRA